MTLPTLSIHLFQPGYILPCHRPKQLYSLINKSNTYTEGQPTSFQGFLVRLGKLQVPTSSPHWYYQCIPLPLYAHTHMHVCMHASTHTCTLHKNTEDYVHTYYWGSRHVDTQCWGWKDIFNRTSSVEPLTPLASSKATLTLRVSQKKTRGQEYEEAPLRKSRLGRARDLERRAGVRTLSMHEIVKEWCNW